MRPHQTRLHRQDAQINPWAFALLISLLVVGCAKSHQRPFDRRSSEHEDSSFFDASVDSRLPERDAEPDASPSPQTERWVLTQTIREPLASGMFGSQVSLSNNGLTLVVGDPSADTRDFDDDAGEAFVYTFRDENWNREAVLDRPPHADEFGSRVEISGDGTRILVGDSIGGQRFGGEATLFALVNGVWQREMILSAPPSTRETGYELAIASNGLRFSVSRMSSSESLELDLYAYASGRWSPPQTMASYREAAFAQNGTEVFLANTQGVRRATREGDGWQVQTSFTLQRSILQSMKVSNDGTRLVATFAEGEEEGEGASRGVRVYTKSNGIWDDGVALEPPAQAHSFGASIALSPDGNVAVVGDLVGTQDRRGAVTVFYLNEGAWRSFSLIRPPNAERFGSNVAVSNGAQVIAVGGSEGTGRAWLYARRNTESSQ